MKRGARLVNFVRRCTVSIDTPKRLATCYSLRPLA
jgi:hypothetical protein